MGEAMLINAVIAAVLLLAAWQVAVRIKDVSFIDAIWGGGMAVLAVASWLQLGEPGQRAHLMAAMAALWGLRLFWHLYTRWRGHGEDVRYARMLDKAKEQGRFAQAALTKVFGPQAFLLYLTCLPASSVCWPAARRLRLGRWLWLVRRCGCSAWCSKWLAMRS